MNAAIIYSTLTEDSKKSAEILEKNINADVVLISVKNAKTACLLKYNFIIMGGAVQMKKTEGRFKRYISRNIKTLLEKPTALYVNSDENLSPDDNLLKVFTRELIDSSLICSNFGCEINPYTGNFIKRRRLKKLTAEGSLNMDEINKFCDFINEVIEKRVE